MIYTSLALVVLSASAAVSPLSRMVHLHPQADSRVSITLHNSGTMFQDLLINGHDYEVKSHEGLTIKAPAGTVVYSNSATNGHRRGDVLLEMSSNVNNSRVDFK